MFLLTKAPIAADQAKGLLHITSEHGVILAFEGIIRGRTTAGLPVDHLEYDCYENMAAPCLREIEYEVNQTWLIDQLAILHRIGSIPIGEPALIVAVASPHTEEAFAACRYVIASVKEHVPLWKKEIASERLKAV